MSKDQSRGSESQKDLSRPSAKEIYVEVAGSARDELKRSVLSLGISGFAGGIFMGFSGLGVAISTALLGSSAVSLFHIIAQMFYPLGFIIVILGRAQLFTENTLYPVALLLAERKHFKHVLRLWAIVANVIGAGAFAPIAEDMSAYFTTLSEVRGAFGMFRYCRTMDACRGSENCSQQLLPVNPIEFECDIRP